MAILTYNGQNIEQRPEDGYINATQMAAIHGKLIADWLRSEDCKRYTEALSLSMGIPIDKMIISKSGRPTRGGGTWVHPRLAIKIGRWISVEFELWCDEHIRNLIETGTTSIKDNWNDPQWLQIRSRGKKKRLELTDEVKAYVERHPELSEKEKKYIFASHSNALNRGFYGRDAKTLKDTLGLKKHHLLRDYFDEDENAAIQDVEHIVAWWIQTKDMHPVTAIVEVIKLIEYSRRFEDRHKEKILIKSAKKTKKLVPGQLSLFG